jgi:hypothetical protein
LYVIQEADNAHKRHNQMEEFAHVHKCVCRRVLLRICGLCDARTHTHAHRHCWQR